MRLLLFLGGGPGGGATTQTIPVTNTALFFSPWNSYSDGVGALQSNNVLDDATYVLWNNTGAKLRFKVTVAGGAGDVKLNLDTTRLSGLTASKCPTLASRIVGVDADYTSTLTAYSASAVQVTLATGLSDGTYEFEVIYASKSATEGDPWATPTQCVVITGVEIDATASVGAVTLRSKLALCMGDSLTEGDDVLGDDTENASNDATQVMTVMIAEAFDAELGNVGFGGIGYGKGLGFVAADADHPSFYNATAANQSWDKYWKGKSRLFSGLFSPAPDYIFINLGTNDTSLSAASVTAVLDAIRTAAGSSCFIFVYNTQNLNRSTIASGVAAVADTSRTFYLAPEVLFTAGTPSIYSNDSGASSNHPNVRGHAHHASDIVKLAMAQIDSVTGGGGGNTYSRGRLVNAGA